jgi:hypothetical protein
MAQRGTVVLMPDAPRANLSPVEHKSQTMHSFAMQLRTITFAAALALLPAAFPALAQELAGHWRKTVIVFESPRDEHLILNADSTFQNWTVTATETGTGTPLAGQWEANGNMLIFRMEGSEDQSSPFTFFEGQLVYPNIEGSRGFWDRVE